MGALAQAPAEVQPEEQPALALALALAPAEVQPEEQQEEQQEVQPEEEVPLPDDKLEVRAALALAPANSHLPFDHGSICSKNFRSRTLLSNCIKKSPQSENSTSIEFLPS